MKAAEDLYRAVLAEDSQHSIANHNLGVLLTQCQQPAMSLAYLRAAMEADPVQPQYWLSYVDALMQVGQADIAQKVALQGLQFGLKPEVVDQLLAKTRGPSQGEINNLVLLFEERRFLDLERQAQELINCFPHSGVSWKALGIAQQALGKARDAINSLQHAAGLLPEDSEVYGNLGLALHHERRYGEAEASYRHALTLAPDSLAILTNLASFLHDQGKIAEAGSLYQRILTIDPNVALVHNNLGLIQRAQMKIAEAELSFRAALALTPAFPEAFNNLGNILKDQGRLLESVASFREALSLKPDFAEAYNNLGCPLKGLGRLTEAEECLRRALAINPHYAEAHNNLGNTLLEQGRLHEAEASFRTALRHKNDFADAYSNLGNVLKDLGRFTEAEKCFREALRIAPNFLEAYDNLLFTYNYTTQYTPSFCLQEARKYGERAAASVSGGFDSWLCSVQPRILRVGIVSGDLWRHPVGYFLEGLLPHLASANQVELIAYPTHCRHDDMTSRLRKHFAGWNSLLGLSDKAAAKLIHADRVHVLLDLSGHTANNRLPVFAWKPAPVQASWLGYFATTGVPGIDFLIADEMSIPFAYESHFSERIWRLPNTRLCFTPPGESLSVAPLPAFRNGYVTFGCFQILGKVSDEVIGLWATIFSKLPNARLRWQCKQFSDPQVLSQVMARLEAHRIDMNRVALYPATSRSNYLKAYSDVDIILDTFPYPGGTTTCEALWMGVPTITMAGDRFLSRQGASLLSAAGLGDWVAYSAEEYVALAIARAEDIAHLNSLRIQLRAMVAETPVFDSANFARNFAMGLWEMFEQWRGRLLLQ